MDYNHARVAGRLVANPHVKSFAARQGQSGLRASFRIQTARKADRQLPAGDFLRRPNHVAVVAWGKLAELCAHYLAKELVVSVTGELIGERLLITDNGRPDGFPVLGPLGEQQYHDFQYLQAEEIRCAAGTLVGMGDGIGTGALERARTALNGGDGGKDEGAKSFDNPY
jgi:hypothetical protein